MSKRGISLLVLVIILTSIFSILPVNALDINSVQNTANQIGETGEKGTQIINTLADPNSRTEFLKAEWGKLIDSTPIGAALNATNNAITPLNPIIKLAIGTPFAWDWLFWITFAIWILAFSAFRKTLLLKLALKLKLYSRPLRLFVAALITSLVGFTTIYYQITKYILILTYKIPNIFIQILINAAIFVLIIMFSSKIGMNKKALEELIREEKRYNELKRIAKEQADEARAEAERKAAQQRQETAELREEVEGENTEKLSLSERELKKQRIKTGLKAIELVGKQIEEAEKTEAELKKKELKKPVTLKAPKKLSPGLTFWEYVKTIFKP